MSTAADPGDLRARLQRFEVLLAELVYGGTTHGICDQWIELKAKVEALLTAVPPSSQIGTTLGYGECGITDAGMVCTLRSSFPSGPPPQQE